MGVVTKFHPRGFIIERLFYIKQYICFHFIPQNHFRWNFSKRGSRGEQGLSNRAVQIRRYQSQSAHQNNPNRFKSNLQKSAITHHSIPSINTPINPSSNPLSHPPWGAHLGRANAPGGSPGSRTLRRSSTTRWNNFTWLTWGEKCGNIVLSKKCESLSLAKEKSLSQWEIER